MSDSDDFQEESDEEPETTLTFSNEAAPDAAAPSAASSAPVAIPRSHFVNTSSKPARPAALDDAWVQTRYNQVDMHLAKLQNECARSGAGYLTEDERYSAKADCEMALQAVKADPRAAAAMATASAVCWAILLARNTAARRPGGFTVDSEAAVELWDMDTMHAILTNYKSDRVTTAEGGPESAALVAHANGPGKTAARHVKSDAKQRSLRLDSLGPEPERRKKAKALDTLLRRGGGDGLAPEVLELQPPRVQTFATVGRAGRVATAASDRWGTKRPRGA